ncbi:hypothetical protein FH972_014993 [Carpinus fangiana]|uniref:Uncharacterized protein n=1 Tax=Carpinus fangiana TaxID=176857 RepID=A0A5N6RBE7_9ROSI|nr:hypothetical protein FH972_014993 [Carpinus fangiana]
MSLEEFLAVKDCVSVILRSESHPSGEGGPMPVSWSKGFPPGCSARDCIKAGHYRPCISLIQKKKATEQQEQHDSLNVRVRASDMPFPLQNRAFRCARDHLDSMPGKLDSKRIALALKKVKEITT